MNNYKEVKPIKSVKTMKKNPNNIIAINKKIYE